jgi:hypothetical protein
MNGEEMISAEEFPSPQKGRVIKKLFESFKGKFMAMFEEEEDEILE